MWQLTPNIRGMVKYRQVNLISDFPHLGMFDLIFCRNVLIYFDQQTKVDLLDRLAQVTRPMAISCSARPRPWWG